jgi:hypothetical protein
MENGVSVLKMEGACSAKTLVTGAFIVAIDYVIIIKLLDSEFNIQWEPQMPYQRFC